ncbi:hypothetical protein HK104_009611 [Borealophlyctis nickersoniae]|nr:hypothetical protein HK104_009611 [Borealophlyctis nickersoniae]
MSSTFTSPDGANIAYRVLGADKKGLPAILVCGLSSIKEDWADFADGIDMLAIAAERPLCIFDNRGIGESMLAPPMPPAITSPPITLLQMATDVFLLLEHLNWRRFHLIGMSMGGMISQQLILLLRGRDDFECVSMTILCSTPKVPRYNILASLYMSRAKIVQERGKLTPQEEMEFGKRLLETVFTPQWVREQGNNLPVVAGRYQMGKRPSKIIAQQIEAVGSFDVTDQLHLIKKPTLVIHGLGDRIFPAENAEAIANGIEGAKLVLLPQEVGHMQVSLLGSSVLMGLQS